MAADETQINADENMPVGVHRRPIRVFLMRGLFDDGDLDGQQLTA